MIQFYSQITLLTLAKVNIHHYRVNALSYVQFLRYTKTIPVLNMWTSISTLFCGLVKFGMTIAIKGTNS